MVGEILPAKCFELTYVAGGAKTRGPRLDEYGYR
jgi:hypothetical protein